MKKSKKTPAAIKNVVRRAAKSSVLIPAEIKNERDRMVSNGLNEAIFGFGQQSIGTQLNQTDTLFKNNRWYLVSNMRQLLSEIYVEHGLVQTIVDVPVDDGMRGGVKIKSKQLSEEEIQELTIAIERQDILNAVVGRALKWNRLYGGAGVLILTDQDPQIPLSVEMLKEDSPLEFRAVDMWELFWDKQNVEGFDPTIQESSFEFYSYYGIKVHKSRVMKMTGLVAPSFIRPRLRGWGFSVVEALVNSVNQYLKANNLIFEVLDEFKVDVYKIKNLANTLMSPDGTAQVHRRIQLANQQKNFQNAITMDGEDDFITKELTFTGIAETMQGIRMQIASDMRMPLTKVFGISASGFNSGEDDIENYNSMVESQVRAKSKYDILRIIEIMSQKLFGYIPDDLQIEFIPLRMLSAEQEENVKTQKFTRLLQAKQAGEISSKDFKDACNKDNLLGVQLDPDEDTLSDNTAAEGSGEPGANKEPTANPEASPAPKSKLETKETREVKNAKENQE